jgi:hypothetical protein
MLLMTYPRISIVGALQMYTRENLMILRTRPSGDMISPSQAGELLTFLAATQLAI